MGSSNQAIDVFFTQIILKFQAHPVDIPFGTNRFTNRLQTRQLSWSKPRRKDILAFLQCFICFMQKNMSFFPKNKASMPQSRIITVFVQT